MVHLKSSEFLAKDVLPVKQMLALKLFLHYIVHSTGSIVNGSDFFFFQGKGLCMVWVMVLYVVSNILPVFTENLGNYSGVNGQHLLCLHRFLLKMSDRSGGIPHRNGVIVPFLWDDQTCLEKRSCRRWQHETHSEELAGSRPSTEKPGTRP